MKVFQQNRGSIVVRVADSVYSDTPANFAADFGQPAPELLAGADHRLYEPGVRHALGDGSGNTVAGGDRAWDFGDAAIAAIDKLLAAQGARAAAAQKSAVEQVAAIAAAAAAKDKSERDDYAAWLATEIPAVERAQLRIWLVQRGKSQADVDAAIAAIADPTARAIARISWDDRTVFRRDFPMFNAMGPALGIAPPDWDDGFRAASKL